MAALQYASQFASYLKADLVLLHCAGEEQLTPTFQSHLMSRLRSFTDRYMPLGAPTITRFCVVRNGYLRENLASVVEYHNVDLLISSPEAFLGYKASGDVVSLKEFAGCPVLIVPQEVTFKPLRKIVYSLNFHDIDTSVIQRVQALARPFGASIVLLYLHGKIETVELCQLQKKAARLKEQFPYAEMSAVFQEEEDLLEGLNDFAEGHSPDLFVMATRDTHLVHEYFSGHYRKTRAYHLNTPFLNLYQARITACSGSCLHCQDDALPFEQEYKPAATRKVQVA
ncbi:universal stress protein [Rufibacter radiotolerans]|uniref:universal stress protein n=1 Tax=Rufibacter radiotolerans TaxID=1379910 RepID=UPI0018CCC3C6|nr:universal stress protein [Rufibacter radiotolerans]